MNIKKEKKIIISIIITFIIIITSVMIPVWSIILVDENILEIYLIVLYTIIVYIAMFGGLFIVIKN